LTHPLVDDQPCFPGDPVPRIKPFHTLAEAGYNTTRFAIGSHQGTHVDAPYHFLRDGTTVDRIPLKTLYGEATLIDLAPEGELGKEATITTPMLERFAASFQEGARVFYRTGWDRRFGDETFYRNYPSLTPGAARWIADRRIALLGTDTPSVATDFMEPHQALLGAGIVIVESLANLDKLPERFTFVGLPLKLKGRDGSPIRAAAVVD